MLRIACIFTILTLMFICMFAAADANEEANKLVEKITRLEKSYDVKLAEKKQLVKERDKYQTEADNLAIRITLLEKKIESTKVEISRAQTESERENLEILLEVFQRRLLVILDEYKVALKERDNLNRRIKIVESEVSRLYSEIMEAYRRLEELLGLDD